MTLSKRSTYAVAVGTTGAAFVLMGLWYWVRSRRNAEEDLVFAAPPPRFNQGLSHADDLLVGLRQRVFALAAKGAATTPNAAAELAQLEEELNQFTAQHLNGLEPTNQEERRERLLREKCVDDLLEKLMDVQGA